MNMKNYSHSEALRIIIAAANEYHNELEDKNFMIIYYENNQLRYKLLNFNGVNFCHLTGAKTNVTAAEFYRLCLNRKLSTKDFETPKGSQNLKLSALPFLSKIFYNGCSMGDFLRSGIYLESDYFVGNARKISVGFKTQKRFDTPRSLLYKDIREITNPTLRVEAIFRKNKSEQYFSEYTYCHKDFDINKVKATEFAYLIQNPHYYKESPDTAEPIKTDPSSDLLKRSNLSEEQIIALSSTKIKFTAQKTGEDTYCIVFHKSDLENINSVLSSLSTKNKTEPPKSKR